MVSGQSQFQKITHWKYDSLHMNFLIKPHEGEQIMAEEHDCKGKTEGVLWGN